MPGLWKFVLVLALLMPGGFLLLPVIWLQRSWARRHAARLTTAASTARTSAPVASAAAPTR